MLRRLYYTCFSSTLLTFGLLSAATLAQENDAAHNPHTADSSGESSQEQWGLIEQYCTDCHNVEDWAGSLALDLMGPDSVPEEPSVWEQVVQKLRGRLMPPPGNPQPEQQRINRFVGWLEGTLDRSTGLNRAGHVPLQRLNRSEYARTVEELVGVEIDPSSFLPTEVEVEGFTNVAEALSVSPAFMDQYVNAARHIAEAAVGDAAAKTTVSQYSAPGGTQSSFKDGMRPGTRGGMSFMHTFPADGEYRLNILDLDVGLYPRSIETRQTVVVLVDDTEVFRAQLGGPEDIALLDQEGPVGSQEIMSRFQDIPMQVSAGTHEVTVTFIERARAESDWWTDSGRYNGYDRVARILGDIELAGPFNPTGVSSTPSREKIFVCEPDDPAAERPCAQQIIRHLAQRAFRRPATQEDVDSLMQFYEQGYALNERFDEGIEHVVAAVLASPDFLYRSISPHKDIGDSQIFALSDLETATRLSFFLWGQGPDEELLDTAMTGTLSNPDTLEREVRRMLADPRAEALVEDFAMKWLNLDDLDAVEPDPQLFPEYTDELRQDFSIEVQRFISSILLEDRPVTELMEADHTFLNERLAEHYGIDNVFGDQFRRVQLENEARYGLLGKSAVLMRTSYGDRTSPVLRGAWVMERVMGTPPSPPPPNVETDLTAPDGEKPTTVRARLEEHRENPSCNQCHGVIDPMGLALENYNVLGEWRDRDALAEVDIDASAVMPTGAEVSGPVSLRRELMKRPEQFVQTLTEKLMMYSLGRELEYFDMPQVRAIVRQAEEQDYRFSAIVLGIARSDAFRRQSTGEEAGEEGVQAAATEENADTGSDNT